MIILMMELGRDYIVWDKAAAIDFKSPGRGKVKVSFTISKEKLREIKNQADTGEKVFPEFETQVEDSSGQVVSVIKKTLYVRKK
jgi:hypothetical protein